MKKLVTIMVTLAVLLVAAFAFGTTLDGKVISGDNPVIGAKVSIKYICNDRVARPLRFHVKTDRNGMFSVGEVTSGTYLVTAFGPDAGFATERVEIADEDVSILLVLRKRDRRIKFGSLVGTIVDSSGLGIKAKVMIMRANNRRNMRRIRALTTMSDRRGNFSFDKLPEGKYVIGACARGVGAVRQRIEVIAGEETKVELILK